MQVSINKQKIISNLESPSFHAGYTIGNTMGTGIAGATLGTIIGAFDPEGSALNGAITGGVLGTGLGLYNSKDNINKIIAK